MDKEKLLKLKTAMTVTEDLAAVIKVKRDEFEASIAMQIETLNSYKADIASLKSELTIEAEAEYGKTGNKKLDGGIGIRVSKTVEYPADKALAWAKEKDMFLMLDDKAFKKAAPGMNLDFVEQVEKVTVTFPAEIKLEG